MLSESILDCGHDAADHSIARDQNDKTLCYRCANERERVAFREAGEQGLAYGAYVGESNGATVITTWTGEQLAVVTRMRPMGRKVPGRAQLFALTAKDSHGRTWYGRSQGAGMAVVLRVKRGAK